eukprot:1159367-Pelagomonas_calceolata.AAC.6
MSGGTKGMRKLSYEDEDIFKMGGAGGAYAGGGHSSGRMGVGAGGRTSASLPLLQAAAPKLAQSCGVL